MILENIDEQLNTLISLLELEGECCGLKHSEEDPSENHKAVDYLCQNMGNVKEGIIQDQIRIPICEECSEALYDTDWILMYCLECNSSQWLNRKLARREYDDGNIIIWMKACPNCFDEE